eukprot:COSAG02_NODE_745_length_17738_cov_18.178241_10_plen_221_part_00
MHQTTYLISFFKKKCCKSAKIPLYHVGQPDRWWARGRRAAVRCIYAHARRRRARARRWIAPEAYRHTAGRKHPSARTPRERRSCDLRSGSTADTLLIGLARSWTRSEMWSLSCEVCLVLSCLCLFLIARPASAHTCIGEPRQHRLRANHPPGTALPGLEKDCRGGLCLGQVNGPHWHDWHNGSGNASYPVGNPHDGFTHFSSTMVRVLLGCSVRDYLLIL